MKYIKLTVKTPSDYKKSSKDVGSGLTPEEKEDLEIQRLIGNIDYLSDSDSVEVRAVYIEPTGFHKAPGYFRSDLFGSMVSSPYGIGTEVEVDGSVYLVEEEPEVILGKLSADVV